MAPGRFTRERRLWGGVALAAGGILAALYPLQFLLDALRARNLLRLSIAALFLAAGGATAVLLAQRRARWRTWLVLGAAAALYALLALAMEVPQERLHLVEYGGLALLVRAALAESVARREIGRRVSSVDVWTAGLVTAFGWLDEAVQGILPNRQYDLRDVAFNAGAAVLALVAAAALRATLPPTGEAGGEKRS